VACVDLQAPDAGPAALPMRRFHDSVAKFLESPLKSDESLSNVSSLSNSLGQLGPNLDSANRDPPAYAADGNSSSLPRVIVTGEPVEGALLVADVQQLQPAITKMLLERDWVRVSADNKTEWPADSGLLEYVVQPHDEGHYMVFRLSRRDRATQALIDRVESEPIGPIRRAGQTPIYVRQ
jgi:hypothetical protein